MFTRIAEFTRIANANEIKTSPSPMTKEEVFFLCRMYISELNELATTVVPIDQCRDFINSACQSSDYPKPYTGKTDIEKMAYQWDAIVDAGYYGGNIGKKFMGLPDETGDEVFNVVHQANMNKIHPDGTVHRRGDGKILKPEGWKEPDVTSVIKKMVESEKSEKNEVKGGREEVEGKNRERDSRGEFTLSLSQIDTLIAKIHVADNEEAERMTNK